MVNGKCHLTSRLKSEHGRMTKYKDFEMNKNSFKWENHECCHGTSATTHVIILLIALVKE